MRADSDDRHLAGIFPDLLDDEIGSGLPDRSFTRKVFGPRVLVLHARIVRRAPDGDRDFIASGQVQHLARDARALSGSPVRGSHTQQFKTFPLNGKGQRPRIINVIANVGIENDFQALRRATFLG